MGAIKPSYLRMLELGEARTQNQLPNTISYGILEILNFQKQFSYIEKRPSFFQYLLCSMTW